MLGAKKAVKTIVVSLIFLGIIPTVVPMGVVSGTPPGVVSRKSWWPAEFAALSPKLKKKWHAAPQDMCGYCNRLWVGGKMIKGKCIGAVATVRGYSAIVYHHSESTDQSPNLVDMAYFHKSKHFCDTAYHFIIKRNAQKHWTVYEATPLGYVGSHAAGFNFFNSEKGSLGIMVAGSFGVKGHQYPDAELKSVMIKLQDWLTTRFGIKEIRTHRDGPYRVNSGFDCPGINMLPLIEELHRRAK